ncbi:unnamed protein product [Penicillium nalgiovense]|nr:unnamed protein product [Penicillium nalgiovense]
MHILPKVHAALATVLLIVSLARLELSRRAGREASHLALDLAISVPKDVLLVVYVGLSWTETNDAVREVILGIASVFPFLLVVRASILSLKLKLTTKDQSLRMSILLRGLTNAPSQLMIYFSLFSLSSCFIKVTATLVGTYVYLPMRGAVLFLHFVDYLNLAFLLWWLDEYTTAHSRTRLQLRCALLWTIGLAVLLLLIAVFGVVLYCWLLFLELQLCILTTWIILSYYAVRNAGSSVGEQSTCSASV